MVLDSAMPAGQIEVILRHKHVHVRDRVQGQATSSERKSAFDVLMAVNRNYTHLSPLKRYVSCRAVLMEKQNYSNLKIL